ncbi:outer membrane lipoprotein carrier protein LolA [Diaphorobacter sp. HDW4A]|uniref:outer membrane lipoprotein carrier protein LolA n=1 Tax=Diaphorobacter sp. HDW4A TaxID=2714924 RepID=UPI00140B337F|nr:outer membrane lipoprotein carrier protein LolA [Diaphorobacter sp. HDW4A]QIL80963.1 outer membrane lipoprotein carrier protein LolA [Diaphorobacter sp. HDW4A]
MKSFVKTSVVWAALLAVVPAAFAEKPGPAAAKDQVTQDLLDKVKQQLKDAPVVRGKFEQEKSIKGFKQPLRSSGEFVVAKNKGIVWHVLKPFESTLIVKPDSLQSRRGDGEVSMQMRAEDEPVLRTVNAMLFAVMSADLVQLRQFFEVSGKAQASGWQMHLVPRDPMLAQWLASVDLQGGAFVREVKLQEARGDSSVIRIQDATAEQALRDVDVALFR